MAQPKPRWGGGGKATKSRTSRQRTDHGNWQTTSSQKRGSYFGTNVLKTTKGGSRLDNPKIRKNKVSHSTLERKAEGIRHQHMLHRMRANKYAQIISADEADIRRLKGIKDALNRKIHEEDDTLADVGGKKARMEGQLISVRKIHSALSKQNKELCARRLRLQQELKAGHQLVGDQKRRFKEVVAVSHGVVFEVQSELERAEALFSKRMEELDSMRMALIRDLKEVEASVDLSELDARRKANERRKSQLALLRQALIEAKAFTLHKALVSTVSASHEQSRRLHQIIAHLQAEQHKTNEQTDNMTAEVNVLKEELEAQEKAHQMLCEQGYAGAKAFEASAAVNGEGIGSPLTKMTRDRDHAAALVANQEGGETQQMKESIGRLEKKLSAAQLHTQRLQSHLQGERERHDGVERETREHLEKERTELLRKAQQLENANAESG